MSDEIKDVVSTDDIAEETTEEITETSLITPPVNLNEESLALISQIIAERDEQKARDLTHLFNANQNKKTMVRVNKLSDLLDTITDQALARFTTRPDEISNKELFDGLKVVQDLIERGQKQVSGAGEMPLIQVNQQNNEVNIGNAPQALSRASRERVKSAVMGLLESIATTVPVPTDAIVVEPEEVFDEEEDNNG